METRIIRLTPELLSFIGTGGVNAITPFTREIFFLDIVVAGTSFCKTISEIEPLLKPSVVLKMFREPSIEQIEPVIGIYYNDTRIGWVPKEHTVVISRLMDAGKAFFCRVDKSKRRGTWLLINARIYMVE